MSERIIVINPNSTREVTEGIDRALEPLRTPGGPEIECLTLAEGPPGIESQRHVDGVIMPLCRLVEQRDNEGSAFVIACFSDPGLHAVRETTRKPVFGIAESGILTAMTQGERFGIIAILATSLARHLRYVRSLGVESRLAGDLPIGLGVVELSQAELVLERMTAVGRRLRDERGADVLVMGCAGMAGYRAPLEEALDIPVVEPTQAATGMALTAVRLAAHTSH
jgi:Asp/Glu/hydantoin racemase